MSAITETRTEPSAVHPGVLASVLVAGHGIKHAYNSGFFLILPEIARAFDLSNSSIGLLNTARTFAGSASNLPAGFVADRFSNRWGRILGLAMVVIGTFQFLMGTVNAYWPLVACAVVVSGSISFWHPPAMAALSHRFPERRGFFISLHGSGGSVGEATGPLIVGALLAVLSWQGILQASLIPAVLTGIVVWFLMRNFRGYDSSAASFGSYVSGLRPFLTNPGLLLVFLSVGGSTAAQAAVNTFLPIYLRIELGYAPVVAAGYLSLGQVAGIVSAPLLGHLSDRYGRRRVLVPSLYALGTGVLALGVVPEGVPLTVAVVALGAFMYPMMALFVATAMDRAGANVQATTVSLVFGIGTLFASVSPLVAGLLADSFGVKSAFFWGAGAAFSAAIIAGFAAAGRPSPSERVAE